MAKRNRSEQLDQAVQALLSRQAPATSIDGEIEPLLRVPRGLRGLPSPDFKTRLQKELERETKMSMAAEAAPTFMRQGFHTLTPYIVVREAQQVIEFVKQVFGGEGKVLGTGSARGIHAEYRIGDSMIMVGGGSEANMTPMPTALHVYVNDVDAVYERALLAGATSLLPPTDKFYGDRDASVKDVAGNHWYIGTHLASGHAPQGLRSVTPCLHPTGAPGVIDFLKRAFGAEEVTRHASPTGVIQHATVRIGDSMIEMGEAHGPFQPMPSMFYLYVENADEWYERALKEGATSLAVPADQPYGDRVAGVTDPSGNHWYMATHLGGRSR
jgi:PhnB protein